MVAVRRINERWTSGEEFEQTDGAASFEGLWRKHDAIPAVAHGPDFDHSTGGETGDVAPPFGQGALTDFGDGHGIEFFHDLRIP
jgi:hypothetical protein